MVDKYPEFVIANNSKFKLFLDAYFEYLEKQNNQTASTILETYKQVQNPGGLIANSDVLRDVDETLDAFVEYFRKEVTSIAIQNGAVTPRFMIKNIRDLYLSKGSPRSFKLLFRLLFDQDIEIFQTKDDILKPSFGTYINFPIAFFQVVEFQSNIYELDLSLARIEDSDGNYLGDVVAGNVAASDSELNSIIKAQLGDAYDFKVGQQLVIVDTEDPNIRIVVRTLPALHSVSPKANGAMYEEGDDIIFKSNFFKKQFSSKVSSVEPGTVDALVIRNRGVHYSVGDTITLYVDEVGKGNGGGAVITAVDDIGRVTEIDGVAVRTGPTNLGYIANRFEDAEVKITGGGYWRVVPKIKIAAAGMTGVGLPALAGSNPATDLQVTPVSASIGKIKDLFFSENAFFKDSEDVVIEIPLNLIVQNISPDLVEGQLVCLQKFTPNGNAFTADSEDLKITLVLEKNDSDTYDNEKIRVPYGFNFDTFEWRVFDFNVDSDNGLAGIQTAFLNSEHFRTHYVDSDGTQTFTIEFPASKEDKKLYNTLESFHYERLIAFNPKSTRFDFSWQTLDRYMSDSEGLVESWLDSDGKKSDVGSWRNLNYHGRVKYIKDSVVALMPVEGYNSIDSEGRINELGKGYKELLRIAPLADSDLSTNVPFTNIVVKSSKAELNFDLRAVVYTNKSFVDEKGFLNSMSGGILQDNFFYSDFTYIIQTKAPLALWRQKVKDLLHPAGTLMLAQLLAEQNVEIQSASNESTGSFTVNNIKAMTFDTSLEHIDRNWKPVELAADNTVYTANPTEIIGDLNINGAEVRADSFFEYTQIPFNLQRGDSWWDFEPLGWIDDSDNIEVVRTTQVADSEGFVKNIKIFYKPNPRHLFQNKPLLSSTTFEDPASSKYFTYTNIDPEAFASFADSERQFAAVDYTKVYVGGKQFKVTQTPRKKEIRLWLEKDFALAMRENGSLTYKVEGITYKDYDAFDRKWDFINVDRTINAAGWEVTGQSSAIQNNSNPVQRGFTNNIIPKEFPQKVPLNEAVWNAGSWIVYNSYGPSINKQSIFEFNYNNDVVLNDSDTDPATLMADRKTFTLTKNK